MNVQEALKYLRIVRKWWWVIVLLTVSTVGTMLAVTLLTEVRYRATVTLYVSAPPPQEVPLYSSFGRQVVQDEIDRAQASLSELMLEGDIAYRVLETLPDVHMRGADLRDRIEIDIPQNSQLMKVSVLAPDPETAALLADAVVDTSVARYGQLLAQPTGNTRKFIEQELETTREELQTAEAALTQFQIANKIGSLNDAISSHYSLIRSLRMQRDLAQAGEDPVNDQALKETILKREAELQALIGLSAEYNELLDRVSRARATYSYLLDKRTEAQIIENQILEMGSIQVITPARPPIKPISAITGKLIVLGAVVSLLFGVILAFVLEYLAVSGTFRSFKKLFEEPQEVAPPSNVSQLVDAQ